MGNPQDYGTLQQHSISDSVVRVIINNPPINLLDHKVIVDLHRFLTNLQNTTTTAPKVVILSSSNPGYFLAHFDLHILSALAPLPSHLSGSSISAQFIECGHLLSSLPTIFIAEIAGQALGAGNELLLQTDLRYAAAPDTKLGSLEIGLGMIHGGGGAQYLTQLIGRAHALEYLLSAQTADAATAAQLGWVNRAFDTEAEMVGFVEALAKRIATFPASALAETKHAVNQQAPSQQSLQRDVQRILKLAERDEVQNAVVRFLDMSGDQVLREWEEGLNENLLKLWE